MTLNTGPIEQLISSIGNLFNLGIPVLLALALVVFFWGLVKYIWGQGKDTAYGRRIMFSGLIAIFVMVSVWGIVALMQEALLGSNKNAGAQIPQIPTTNRFNGYNAPCSGSVDCLNSNI